MRDLKNKLTSSKNDRFNNSYVGKMFGYQVLGFGGGIALPPYEIQYVVAAGGAGVPAAARWGWPVAGVRGRRSR